MPDVVSLEHIQSLARRARAAGTPIDQACPWPAGTAAADAFADAYEQAGEQS